MAEGDGGLLRGQGPGVPGGDRPATEVATARRSPVVHVGRTDAGLEVIVKPASREWLVAIEGADEHWHHFEDRYATRPDAVRVAAGFCAVLSREAVSWLAGHGGLVPAPREEVAAEES